MSNTAQKIMSGVTATGVDLSILDGEDLTRVTYRVPVIEDLEGEAISGFIIVGKNSQEYQEASSEVRISNIQRASARNKQIDGKTVEGATVVSKTVAQQEKRIALAVVVDWFGFNANGVAVPFDKATAERFLTKFPQWQNKITTALDNDANFMKVSSPT